VGPGECKAIGYFSLFFLVMVWGLEIKALWLLDI
jgi:hypothetical protein